MDNEVKRVIIMRGLPGSGKSTKARSYGGTIVSADDYFMSGGEYRFDPAKIGAAHADCKRKFEEALKRGDSIIVVDNTNTMSWEYQPYADMAKRYGYEVEIDAVGDATPSALLPQQLSDRNLHGVPPASIEKMVQRWEGEPHNPEVGQSVAFRSDWLKRVGHCGVCHEIQFAALHTLADIAAEHPDYVDLEVLGELAELTADLKIVEFTEILSSVIMAIEDKPDMADKVLELKNKNAVLVDIANKIDSGDMELVDVPASEKMASASLWKSAGFPKHPDTVVVQPNEWYPQGLNESQVWNFYDSVKDKLIKELSGHNVMLVIATPVGPVIKRNNSKTKSPIRIDTVEQFDAINSGRVIEFHKAIGPTTDELWVDIDPGELVDWSKVIDSAIKVSNALIPYSKAHPPTIHFSGGRGFHIRGYLKHPMDTDATRDALIKFLNKDVVPAIGASTTSINRDPGGIRLDCSTFKNTGSIRAPWSLNAKTGLVDASNEDVGKGMAALERGDFTIDHFYRGTDTLSDSRYIDDAGTIPIGISSSISADKIKVIAVSKEQERAALSKLVQVADSNGFRVYLVGGSVRDKLMGKEPKDLDIVVFHPQYGLQAPARLSELAKEQLGAHGGELTNQGTVMCRIDDVALDLAAPRSETYTADSRKPDVAAGTIEEDAMRRDFTINALYEDLQNPSPNLEDRIIDPTGRGVEDIKSKVLRSPNPEGTFLDDPLRMLRAIRFHAKTGFELDPVTEQELKNALPKFKEFLGTQKLSWERVKEELEKTLSGDAPGKAVKMMSDYGMAEHIFGEPWKKMVGLPHDTPHHQETVDVHTEMVMDEIGKMADSDIALRLSALLHDIGKPASRGIGDKLGSFLGHEDVGAEMAEAILRQLHFPNDIVDRVKFIVQHHMRPHGYTPEWSDKAVRKFIREMGEELQSVLRLAEADSRGRQVDGTESEDGLNKLQELRERIQKVQESDKGVDVSKIRPPLDGNELQQLLGMKPGPWIRQVMDHLTDLQMGNPALTKEEAAEAAKSFMASQAPKEEAPAEVPAPGMGTESSFMDYLSRAAETPGQSSRSTFSTIGETPSGSSSPHPQPSSADSQAGPSEQKTSTPSVPPPSESASVPPSDRDRVTGHPWFVKAYEEARPILQKYAPDPSGGNPAPESVYAVRAILHARFHDLMDPFIEEYGEAAISRPEYQAIQPETRKLADELQVLYDLMTALKIRDKDSTEDALVKMDELLAKSEVDRSAAQSGKMKRVSYIVHMPGHKDSEGNLAPWVIKKHETGEVLSSHGNEAEAKKHLQQIRYFKHNEGSLSVSASQLKFDENSTVNEGRWRIQDPMDFDPASFRRWKTWAGVVAPEGVTFIVGDTKMGAKSLQAIRFNLGQWDEASAGKWWDNVFDNPGFIKTWKVEHKRKSFIGSSGFSHSAWQGGFYPDSVKREDRLRHYSGRFSCVEISSTYHSVPPIRVFETWAGMVPDGFKFAFRAPHDVHPSGMWSGGEVMMGLFMKYAGLLGDKLGPVSIHIPHWEKYAVGDAKKFFSLLPPHRYAIQIDSEEWRNDEVLKEMLMRGHVVVATEAERTITDGLGWSYYRIAASEATKMKDVLDGSINQNNVFVADKNQTFPSAEFIALMKYLGHKVGPDGKLTDTKIIGPITDPATGPGGSSLPGAANEIEDAGEPLAVADPRSKITGDDGGTKGSRGDKYRGVVELTPLTSYPDLDSNDGASNPLGGQIDGSTNTL